MGEEEHRPQTTIAREKQQQWLRAARVPQTELSLVENFRCSSPLQGLEVQHSKDRILNTTFQQKKFN